MHSHTLDSLGKDALSLVAKHLTPEDRARLAKASATLNKAVKTSYEVKLQLHFPEKYAELKTAENIDWKKEFSETYKKVYKDVPQRVRDLFSAIKEQDIKALQGKFILSEDLYTRDSFGKNLLAYVKNSENVQLKEYVFDQLCGEYSNAKGLLLADYQDSKNNTLLFWAIRLLQNPENISVLLARQSDINNVTKNYELTAMHIAAMYNPQVIDLLAKRQPSLIEQQSKAGNTPLLFAISSGEPAAAIKLLELGANPENQITDGDRLLAVGSNALHLAAKYGQAAVVELILQKDINLDAANYSDNCKQALHYAAETGNLEIVKMLVRKRISLILATTSGGYSPLTLAAENGHDDVVRYLLDATDDYLKHQYNDSIQRGIFKALNNAIKKGQVNIIDMILPRLYNITKSSHTENVAENIASALSVAAKMNDLASIKKIISYYPEIINKNIYGCAMIAAAKAGNAECLKYLIKNNARAVNYKNAEGETTLVVAAQTGNVAMVKYLCDLGTKTKSTENAAPNLDYNAALMQAVMQGNVEMVKTLLDKIVTIDHAEEGELKRKAIHLAVGEFANLEIVKLILEKFPKQVNSITATGVAPLDVAIRYPNLEIYKYLLSKGADISRKTKESDNLRYDIKAQDKTSMPKKIKEQMLALYDLKEYLRVRDSKNEYEKQFTLFRASFFNKPIKILGRKYNFSKTEKMAAAHAALEAALNGKDKASLNQYKDELRNGSLGNIAKRLGIR